MEQNNNWFHDLFINEAKPALKRHSGNGGSSNPITEPITITENGVYPVPKGGSFEFDKEYTFKDAITAEEFDTYIAGSNGGEDVGGMRAYVLCDAVELSVIPADATTNVYMLTVITNGAENAILYVLGGSAFGLADGWQLADKTPTNAPTITVADHAKMSADLATTAIFFDVETKSLDGWGDITVNVAGSGGAELNIAYGDTAPEDTSKLWVKTTQPSAVKVSSELVKVASGDTSFETLAIQTEVSEGETSYAQVGDWMYCFCAGDTTSIYKHDLKNEVIVKLGTVFPLVLRSMGCVAVGSKIYCIGGQNKSNGACPTTVYCFDTESETISLMSATAIQGGYRMGAAEYDGKIYLFGGSHNTVGNLDIIQCFDTKTKEITQCQSVLPNAQQGLKAVTHGDSIYLFSTAFVWKFNCLTETVETLPITMPSGTIATVNKVGNTIYVFYQYTKVVVFDCETETSNTITATVSFPTWRMASAVDNEDNIYVLYGSNNNKIFKCNPGLQISVSPDILQIRSNLIRNIFNIINTDDIQFEIGVTAVYKGNSDGVGEQVEAALHSGETWVTI